MHREMFSFDLLGNERGNVALECSGTNAHDDDCNGKAGNCAVRVLDDARNGGDDEQDVSEERDSDGHADSLVAAPVRIRDVRPEKWHHVDPEAVEGRQAGRRALAQAKGTALAVLATRSRMGAGRQLLLDEIGEDNGGAIVGEALGELNECDEVGSPGNGVGNAAEVDALLVGRVSAVRGRPVGVVEGVGDVAVSAMLLLILKLVPRRVREAANDGVVGL